MSRPPLLVIAGLAVGLLPGVPAVRVAPDVVSLVVLPPLLYAASEELPWRDLRLVWRPVTVLAVGLVLASAAAVAAVTWAANPTACVSSHDPEVTHRVDRICRDEQGEPGSCISVSGYPLGWSWVWVIVC